MRIYQPPVIHRRNVVPREVPAATNSSKGPEAPENPQRPQEGAIDLTKNPFKFTNTDSATSLASSKRPSLTLPLETKNLGAITAVKRKESSSYVESTFLMKPTELACSTERRRSSTAELLPADSRKSSIANSTSERRGSASSTNRRSSTTVQERRKSITFKKPQASDPIQADAKEPTVSSKIPTRPALKKQPKAEVATKSQNDSKSKPKTVVRRRVVKAADGAEPNSEDVSDKPKKKIVLVKRKVLKPKTSAGAVAPSAGGSGEVPAHVRDYDDGMFDVLSRFGALSDKIGGDCGTAGKQVTEIFSELRTLLWTAAGQAEPNATALQKLIEPMGKKLGSLNDFRESKRNTPHFNHLSAVAEGIQAVGWVAVKPTPAPFVKDMLESSMFFVNRVLKDHKDGDATHTEWAKCWIEVMNTLQTFVRKTHTTGLVWNSAPGSAPPSKGGASVAPVTPSAGGPPPPPPPPPADFLGTPSKGDSDKAARNELFKELNQGENITSKLKKVTSDMQTHKNPNLRASAVVPATAATGASVSAPAKAAPAAQKPPKIELENGKQWIVENFKNDKNVVVEVTDKKQTVYIYKCEGSVIRINGKANSITMDQCKKTAIAFDGIVAQIETINCQSVEIQTLGDMPTLSIQKTDGCQVYLSEAALGSEIVTSKSSEMNVHIPKKDGDFVELALPEQFKTVYKNGKLETTISDI